MSTVTLTTVSDKFAGSNWSKTGGAGSYSSLLSDGSDSTYGSIADNQPGAQAFLRLNLSAIPGNVLSISAVQISLRCKTNAANKTNSKLQTSVGNTTSDTQLSSNVQVTPTSSFTTINTSATLNDSTIADWSTAYVLIADINDANGNTLSVAEASVILTVTLLSAPGTPTNLAGSYGSGTSTTLTWTQGSGTVTDNKYETSTDGTTFGAPVDIGSAVTTVTVTGLTPNTLYFFRVCASNSGGDSAYTAGVPWVTGSTFTGQVAASNQDAFENTIGTTTITDSTDTLLVNELLGFLVEGVTINRYTDVTAAYLFVYLASVTGIAGSVSLDCQTGTVGVFGTGSMNISNRTLTGQAVTWSIAGLSTGWNSSPSLGPALQAVFDQPSAWNNPGNVAVIVKGLAAAAGFDVEMWDGNPVQAAILAVFTGAGLPNAPGVVSGAARSSGLIGDAPPPPFTIMTAVMGSRTW